MEQVDPDSLSARAKVVRDQFLASGTSITDWARERGFDRQLVSQVINGNRRCVRGESHRIAVALGIKPEVAAPGVEDQRDERTPPPSPADALDRRPPHLGATDLEPAR